MRVIERLQTLVSPTGLIGVMSSGRGSVSNNVYGEAELYRGSKARRESFWEGGKLWKVCVEQGRLMLHPVCLSDRATEAVRDRRSNLVRSGPNPGFCGFARWRPEGRDPQNWRASRNRPPSPPQRWI